MTKIKHTTVDSARQHAIEWQNWVSDTQSISYGELAECGAYFAALAVQFPELPDEFKENGII